MQKRRRIGVLTATVAVAVMLIAPATGEAKTTLTDHCIHVGPITLCYVTP
jgi:hypothetical protein